MKDNMYRVMRDNKLIVEFLGYENIGTYNHPMYTFYDNYFEDGNRELEELCYHKSWDWLIPVVESIERLGYEFFIVEDRVKVSHNTDHSIETIIDLTSRSKLNATYNAVVEFINKYNKKQIELYRQKNNKLIAEFMGFTLDTPTNIEGEVWYDNEEVYLHISSEFKHSNCFKELQFHKSWDWLMPVVEKIESDERYDVAILQYDTRITDNQKEIVNNIADISFDKKIDHIYDAVVKFINQYNKTK